MIYYNISIIILIVVFDLTILAMVWQVMKGPNKLSELKAAVCSFALIACGVVMTFTALSTIQ